jgi:hypothetical protein
MASPTSRRQSRYSPHPVKARFQKDLAESYQEGSERRLTTHCRQQAGVITIVAANSGPFQE